MHDGCLTYMRSSDRCDDANNVNFKFSRSSRQTLSIFNFQVWLVVSQPGRSRDGGIKKGRGNIENVEGLHCNEMSP